MSSRNFKLEGVPFLVLVGFAGWWIPGMGHLLIGKKNAAGVIFGAIIFALIVGLWVGSIAVIDSHEPWYWAQMLISPFLGLLSYLNGTEYHISVFGKPREIGQIYTGVAGMLNLLCIVNAVYLGHIINIKKRESR